MGATKFVLGTLELQVCVAVNYPSYINKILIHIHIFLGYY